MQRPETKPKGLSLALVARAAELVNYQDGAVVSREIPHALKALQRFKMILTMIRS